MTSVVFFGSTTGRRNTHGTEVRELLYPWHPWSGQLIHIHELVDKGSAVFRCSLSGSTSCRLLEVPVWMFDRTPSAQWLAVPVAYVDFSGLAALAKLLEEAGISVIRPDAEVSHDRPVNGQNLARPTLAHPMLLADMSHSVLTRILNFISAPFGPLMAGYGLPIVLTVQAIILFGCTAAFARPEHHRRALNLRKKRVEYGEVFSLST